MSALKNLAVALLARQKTTVAILRNGIRLKSFARSFQLAAVEVAIGAKISVTPDFIRVEQEGFTFQFERVHWAIDHLQTLVELQRELEVNYVFGSGTVSIEFEYQARKFKFSLISGHELGIIREVFYDSLYHPLNSLPAVDIGANFGAVSIFLAGAKGVSVVAFEPVPETYQRLVEHIKLNNLEEKINPYNVGIAAADGSATILYDRTYPGSASIEGIYGEAQTVADVPIEGEKIEIQLRSADWLMEELTEPSYFLKLDCEGAEHQILDALCGHPSFEKFRMISTEVHSIGPGSIEAFEKKLLAASFSLYRLATPTDDVTHLIGARD